MSSKNSALASLTATYTDSENEDQDSDDSGGSESSKDSQVIIPIQQKSDNHLSPTNYLQYQYQQKETILKQSSTTTSTTTTTIISSTHSSLRLVNYNDDNVVSDDENVSPNHNDEILNMDISEDEIELHKTPEETNQIQYDKYSHYGFSLPPEPKGKVPIELNEKILNLYDKMRTTNMDMNKIIQERKEFRNPSIYEKLIHFCDINEFGTNYPPEIYDPLQWGPESYYEELAKAQKVEMLKRQKERKDGTSGTDKNDQPTQAKKAEEDAKKRKSKWDQPAPVPNTSVKTNITAPALTSNVTGTKGTVISAFGSLPKKASI